MPHHSVWTCAALAAALCLAPPPASAQPGRPPGSQPAGTPPGTLPGESTQAGADVQARKDCGRPAESLGFREGCVTAFAVVLDNDVIPHLGPGNEDRNYTGGLGFRLSGYTVRRAGLTRPLEALDRLTRVDRRFAANNRTYHSALLFGTGFTPDDLRQADVIPDDRPYGSLVGISVRRMSVEPASLDSAWSSDLTVAVLGLDVARRVQTALHRRLRERSGKETPYDPKGWHNQISDGGEPTAVYRVGYERRLAGHSSMRDRKHWQLIGGVEGSAGYYTNASAALWSRVGWFTSNFWEYSSGGLNLGVGQQKVASEEAPRWDLFLFGVARPRLVVYNALLQGQVRDSVHTVTPRVMTAEWEGGVALSVPLWSFQVGAVWQFAQGRSAEFRTPSPRAHGWGSIVVTVSRPGGTK